jgi:hypothetical protein
LRFTVRYAPQSFDVCKYVPSGWGRARGSKKDRGSTASPVSPELSMIHFRSHSLVIDQQESPLSGTNASRYTSAATRSGDWSATPVMTLPA